MTLPTPDDAALAGARRIVEAVEAYTAIATKQSEKSVTPCAEHLAKDTPQSGDPSLQATPDEWARLARRLAREVLAQSARIAALETEVYCPGLWKCAKCGFGMVCKVIDMSAAILGANNSPQQCMNGCGPMWRVTERTNRIEMQDGYEAATLQLSDLKARAEAAERALAEARANNERGQALMTALVTQMQLRADDMEKGGTLYEHAGAIRGSLATGSEAYIALWLRDLAEAKKNARTPGTVEVCEIPSCATRDFTRGCYKSGDARAVGCPHDPIQRDKAVEKT